jgi:hypothetical protein
MSSPCYLCGQKILASQKRSDDHVVPTTLITRTQPKAKGFDYGGYLPTHEECNNRFGPETYVSKALDLLSVLNAEDAWHPLQNATHPEISILPVNADRLSHFTARDRAYFKLIDARELDISVLSDPATYVGHQKTDPMRDALWVSLSVLAKSAAAILVKRQLPRVPRFWRIHANPYTGDLRNFDLSDLVGETKPFDCELRIWAIELPRNNWHVVYAAGDTLVFFTFVFEDRGRALNEVLAAHKGSTTYTFSGATINELLATGWREI